jgi:hypothetical protein
MGLYIRKSFKAGPIRLNLSKSGLGASIGVKGLRVGSGPRGSYIHAGRGGLYYREKIGSSRKYPSTSQGTTSSLGIIGGLIALIFAILVIQWFVENPAVFVMAIIVTGLIGGFLFYKKKSRSKAIEDYKKALDEVFVLESKEFNEDYLLKLKAILINNNSKSEVESIENNIYTALLDKIIDDNEITSSEKNAIQNLESVISISDLYKKEAKLEIFKSYYLNAIEDRLITDLEINTLNNITEGLGMEQSDIRKEMQTVNKIIKMQGLQHPLPTLSTVPIAIQKSETAFYSSSGKVLTRKKAPRNSSSQYEYSIKREGNLVVTNKRVLVVNEGTTSVDISDILDVDVDIDDNFILISKGKSDTPTIIQTDEALYCGKIIDIIKTNVAQ